jgi:hypothetical protein
MHEQYQFCPWCYEDMSMVLWRYVPGVTRSKQYTPISSLTFMKMFLVLLLLSVVLPLVNGVTSCKLVHKKDKWHNWSTLYYSWIKLTLMFSVQYSVFQHIDLMHEQYQFCPWCYEDMSMVLWRYVPGVTRSKQYTVLPHVNCFIKRINNIIEVNYIIVE